METSGKEINGGVALAVPKYENKYLLMKRSEENSSSGQWTFPGGKIENGENPEAAALRELKEETGLNGELLETGETYIGEGELGYWKIFPSHVEVNEKEVELNHEHSDYKWISLEELKTHDTMGEMKSLKALNLI